MRALEAATSNRHTSTQGLGITNYHAHKVSILTHPPASIHIHLNPTTRKKRPRRTSIQHRCTQRRGHEGAARCRRETIKRIPDSSNGDGGRWRALVEDGLAPGFLNMPAGKHDKGKSPRSFRLTPEVNTPNPEKLSSKSRDRGSVHPNT